MQVTIEKKEKDRLTAENNDITFGQGQNSRRQSQLNISDEEENAPENIRETRRETKMNPSTRTVTKQDQESSSYFNSSSLNYRTSMKGLMQWKGL